MTLTRAPTVRLTRQIYRPFEKEFGDVMERLERHSKTADQTAIAAEMLHAAEFRRGMPPCLQSVGCADVRVATELKDKQNLKMRCEAWLGPANMKAVHHFQVRTKLHGTCEWVWTNNTFQEWNASPSSQVASDRILAIHGIHGCGKTVLASSIISGFDARGQRCLFFSFSGTDATRQSTDSLVRSFIWQLLRDDPEDNGLEVVKGLILKGEPLESELWDAFSKIVRQPSVYCVVDGVDECIEPCQSLIDRLLCLLTVEPHVKVIVLGRSHALKPLLGEAKYQIEMSVPLIKQDIDAYITSAIGHHDLLCLPQLRKPVSQKLQESAGGMFLWAKLMIDHLGRSANQTQVLKRLQDVPHGLDKAYCTVLSRLADQLDPYDLAFVRNILTLMTISMRSLNIEESQCAQALVSGSPDTFEERLECRQKQKILDLCGGLVIVADERLHLVHFSLKELLTRPMNIWTHSNDPLVGAFHVNVEHAHQSLSAGSIGYLRKVEYGSPLFDENAFPVLGKRYPFLEYASRYTTFHLNRSGPILPHILDALREFFESEKSIPWMEYFSMILLEDSSDGTLYLELEKLIDQIGQNGQLESFLTPRLQELLDAELGRRVRSFGGQDLRTRQWRSLLEILQKASPDGHDTRQSTSSMEMVHGDHHDSPQSEDLLQNAINPSMLPALAQMPTPRGQVLPLAPLLGFLRTTAAIPLHRQVDMLIRIQSYLQTVKVLTDPLKLLFRIIISKAAIMPVLVLVVIGEFYFRVNKLDESLEVAYAALKKLDGQETPMKYLITGKIARIFRKRRKYQEAERVDRQTWLGMRSILGQDHKDTLRAASNLCSTLEHLGRYEEAEVLGRQTLTARKKVLGDEHPSTLRSANRLSRYLSKLGRHEEAEVLGRQTLMTRKKVLGDEHPDTLLSASSLSRYLSNLRRHEEAEVLDRQTWLARRKVLGDEHQDTLRSACNLSYDLSKLGRYEEAEVLDRQTLMVRRKVLGDEHPDTLLSARNLSYDLSKLGRYEEAESLAVKP
jgi:hypothetical protein